MVKNKQISVEEAKKKRKKLLEEKPEIEEAEKISAAIPENKKPQGVTQADINALLSAGQDPFRAKNLRALTAKETGAQAGIIQTQEQISALIKPKEKELLQPPEMNETLNDKGVISKINKLGENIGAGSLQTKEGVPIGQAIVKSGMKKVAETYDFIYSLTQGGKGIQQKEAESTFSDIQSTINTELEAVKSGAISADDVREIINIAEKTNVRLESSSKGWSQKNLRYFITDGIDVQTQVALNRDKIEIWKMKLIEAERQGIINQLGLK